MHLCTCEGLNYTALHEYLMHLIETSHIFPHRLTASPKSFGFYPQKMSEQVGKPFPIGQVLTILKHCPHGPHLFESNIASKEPTTLHLKAASSFSLHSQRQRFVFLDF